MTATPFPARFADGSPAIITNGLIDGLLATPEEAALLEAMDRRRIYEADRANDALLAGAWACSCCATPGAAVDEYGRVAPDGLCPECRAEARKQTAVEAGQAISAARRRQLVEKFLARDGT